MRKHRRRNWLVRGFVLGLAVLVVGVPVAQARVDGSTAWSGPRHAQGVSDVSSTSSQQALRSNWLGVAQPKTAPESPAAPTQVVSRSDGFDWGDAGIGAGTVFAVILLAAGGLLAGRRVLHEATV